MKSFHLRLLTFVFCLQTVSLLAQKTTIYTHQDVTFQAALELFDKQKYASAQHEFEKVIASYPDRTSFVRMDAEYYAAVCALELFHKDCEVRLVGFINNYPESPKVNQGYFHLGKYYYRKKKYDDAIKWLEKVEVYDLVTEDKPEFYFKRGYSYLETGNSAQAKKDLYEIKDGESKYFAPANYYFAHLAYLDLNFETALLGFRKLLHTETFGPIVPFYITQIYFKQSKYDSVIIVAPPLLNDTTVGVKMTHEINRLIGESYYKTNKFAQAIPYLRKYESGGGNLKRDGNYQLGYAYYKSNSLDSAIYYLQNATNVDNGNEDENSLTQNAYYLLADCNLKKGNKRLARSAFYAASRLEFDKAIEEDALYNFAKLSYEISYNPYSEAIEAFQFYLQKYPDSKRKDEAYEYLVNLFLTTKNYKEALAHISQIKDLTPLLKAAFQRIAFLRANDLYVNATANNNNLDSSIKYFDKALIYRSDKKITALSIYWKAEAYYRKGQEDIAIDLYEAFQQEPGAGDLKEFNLANYGTGYAYFSQKDYARANIAFRKYLQGKSEPADKMADANARVGDGFYMLRDFNNAAEFYANAVRLKKSDVDYCLYQKALCQGLLQKKDMKVNDLRQLIAEYPKSLLIKKAKSELAHTLQITNRTDEAIAMYKKLIEESANNAELSGYYSSLALLYTNKNDNDNALIYYRKIIQLDKGSDEAKMAINSIKQIYKDKDDAAGVQNEMKDLNIDISKTYVDTIAFTKAAKLFDNGKFEEATKEFAAYIEKFPDGLQINKAYFYKAECDYRSSRNEEALKGYTYIITNGKGWKLEEALQKASRINNWVKKDYAAAIVNYEQLEQIAQVSKNKMDARIGLMRCYFQVNNFEKAIAASQLVLTTEKITQDVKEEAHLIAGKSYLALQKQDDALSEFQVTVNMSKSDLGAEAKYQVAAIKFLKADYKACEKTIFELINREPSSPFWMTKGLVLLSDNYLAQNDKFQAKQTLKTVIDNTEFPELLKEAQAKMNQIIEGEKQPVKPAPPEVEVPFDNSGNNPGNKQLFSDPAKENNANKLVEAPAPN